MIMFHIAVRACLAASMICAAAAHHAAAQTSLSGKVHAGVVFQTLPSLRATTAHRGPLHVTEVPSLEGSPVEYLILTDAAFVTQFERLARWKTQKGVPAVVRTLDDVVSSARAGSDLAETLRNYIRDAYLYWGVQFVLLGGDTDIIPTRYVEVDLLQLQKPPTELYYSCLNGSWNADGDGFFGEPGTHELDPGDEVDLQAEVYLGRAPVSTVSEATVFVDKALRHERPLDTTFQSDMLLLAEALFPSDWQPGGPPPTADGATFAEEIVAVVPGAMSLTRLYEAQELWPGTTRLTLDGARDAINAGYGTVVHVGHGYRYTLSCGNGSLDVPDASELMNGARAGLFYMLNCTATAYDFDSMAEALLLNAQGGANIVVGAAREAFPLAARGYQKEFFTEVFARGERRVGVAMTRSRERVVQGRPLSTVDLWTQLVYTLLGDPEASITSTMRDDLRIEGVPSAFAVGRSEIALQVANDDGPVAGALVCMLKQDDEYRVVRTDANGEAVVDVQWGTVGDATVTVTAADHVPVERVVPVSAADVALGVRDPGLQDDGGTAGFANADGVLDAGETVTLTLPLRNAGSATATGIGGTLFPEDATVEVLQATSTYPDLAGGTQADAETPFEVRVATSVGDGRSVRLRLEVQHAGGSETRRVLLKVARARCEIVSLRVDDSRAGNGDGIQDAGEEVDLYYSVVNRGSGAATNVELQLDSAVGALELLSASAPIGDIASGQTRESTTALTVREPDVSQSRTAVLRLLHRQEPGGSTTLFEPRLPQPPTGLRFGIADAPDAVNLAWEPNAESDLLGYNVYRAASESGPFVRVNSDAVLHAYFRDTDLAASTRYFYRVAALDAARFEGPASAVTSASTNPPQLAGWPLAVDDFSASSPVVGNVNAEDGVEIVAASRQVFAWDARGVELRDADGNALTWGVFFGDREVYGSVTLADMDPRPGREIVVATWDATRRFVTVVDGTGAPLPGWPQPLVPANESMRGAHVPPVVANVDGDGAPEVLLAARDGRLYGWHADGSEMADGDGNPGTHGVLLDTGSPFLRCAPGVADLDPAHPGLEIVLGTTDGKLYVVGARGDVLPGWPRTTGGDGRAFGALFASGIAIADLDRDGTLEMVFLESAGRLHAMHTDGTELAGFPVDGLRSTGPSIVPSVALGDLLGDDALEIVAATSSGQIQIIDAAGNPLLSRPIDSGAPSESSPLLGDVDGDGDIEIVFGNEDGILNAWKLDGGPVDGFPIALGSEIRATPQLADVQGNGTAALVVQAWGGTVSVLDLGVSWHDARFPWPMYRGNIHRTGEYGFEVPTPVVLSDVESRAHDDGRIELRWHAATDDAELLWSVWRAGPFDTEPALDAAHGASWRELGRLRGQGTLRFEDRPPRRGLWYVYALRTTSDGAPFERRIRVRAAAPAALRLHPAFPNPFRPATRLAFDVPATTTAAEAGPRVRIDIYDVHGRHVRRLVDAVYPPGAHGIDWDGRDGQGRTLASGIYVVQLRAGRAVRSQKVVRLR